MAKEGRTLQTSSMNRIKLLNVQESRLPVNNPLKFDVKRTPGKPGSGLCAIPLLQLRIPTDVDFTIQRLVPTAIDENFTAKLSVPSCQG
jgi:hypothetical protein